MLSEKFSGFIQSVKYEKFPDDVIEKTKLCFIDFLGVTLRGSQTKSGQAIKNILKVNGDAEGESTVIFNGKASAMDAGLANGVFAHSLDLDDGHRQAHLHPGACVIPAALSVCEAQNKSGKELIESIVAGYQVAIILGIMVNPEHRRRGFHSTGTCGTFGAAAAASKAMDLDSAKTMNALGLAGTQASGLLETDHSGSMGKHLHTGKAVQSGILSALLANEDFGGSETIFEGDEGFFMSMAGINPNEIDKKSSPIDMDKYKILEVYFKIYPFCRHLHSSVDALLHIKKQHDIKPQDIEQIFVKTYEIAAEHNHYHPTSKEALKQSLPVTMAVSLLNNIRGLNSLVDFDYPTIDPILNQKIDEISKRIQIIPDKDLENQYPDYRPAKVTIKTKKGLYEKKVDLPYGEPENPLKKSDIIWKFINLNPKTDLQVLKMIDQIESYQNINNFMENLKTFLKR